MVVRVSVFPFLIDMEPFPKGRELLMVIIQGGFDPGKAFHQIFPILRKLRGVGSAYQRERVVVHDKDLERP